MMKTFTAFATMLTLASSLPTPTSARELPTVQLKTIGPSTNYNLDASVQNGLDNTNSGHIINVPLGTSLSSFEQKPLQLQGIEIQGVEGAALDDVECKANIGFSSQGVTVRVGDGMVMLNTKGKVVQVTGLSCYVSQRRKTGRDEHA